MLFALLLCMAALVCVVCGSASFHSESVAVMPLQKSRSDLIQRNRPKWYQQHQRSPPNMQVNGSVWPASIYWTTIQVGTPPVGYAVSIDSGSNSLFLSGKGCKGCVATPPNIAYDPSASSTSKALHVPFNSTYSTCNPSFPTETCTIKGSMYADVVSAAGFGPAPIQLGAIEQQSANAYQFQTIEGIMGMCGGPVSGNVFQTLCVFNNNGTTYKDNVCRDPRWGICFVEGTKSNGTMTFGGVDARLSEGPILYVPSNTYNGAMPNAVAVSRISFGNASVPVGQSDSMAFLDTGTNDIVLPASLYVAAEEAICGPAANPSALAHCRDFFASGTNCYALTDAEIAAYPDIVFHLDEDVEVRMTSRDYLLFGSPAAALPNQVCFGIGKGGEGFFIFGDTAMRNYYVVFALDQVGFGKVNRNTCGSL